MMINIRSDSIVISRKKENLIMLVINILMLLPGLFIFVRTILAVSQLETETLIVGLIFILVWLSVIIGFSIYNYNEFYKEIIINPDGIKYKTKFIKRTIPWCDIKDYGLSYLHIRRSRMIFCLYFSEEYLKMKGKYRKALKPYTLKIDVCNDDYYTAINKVLPFCRQFTQIDYFESQR